MSRVFAFLGLDDHKCRPLIEKQAAYAAEDLLENFGELYRHFKDTPYESFF